MIGLSRLQKFTFIIKQDLSSLNSQMSQLQSLSKPQHSQISRNAGGDQVGEHNKNVCFPKSKRVRKVMWEQVVVLLQGKLADVGVNFKEGPRSANEKHSSNHAPGQRTSFPPSHLTLSQTLTLINRHPPCITPPRSPEHLNLAIRIQALTS